MDIDFLTIMAYLIVVITLITMAFGIIAYTVYKMREAKRAKIKHEVTSMQEDQDAKKEKYLFFEEKEIIV